MVRLPRHIPAAPRPPNPRAALLARGLAYRSPLPLETMNDQDRFHHEVTSEQEYRESLERKHPSLRAWPGKKEQMSVYKAITKVQAALASVGISKDRKNTQQGYNFRGIDDVYNVLSPLLAEHGLCILPRMIARTCEERQTAKGGVLFSVTVEAEFDFVCAEDGSMHTVRTFGEAMDSGDKATNKAMSAAYKYAAFQAFAIPTEGDNDADAHTHQVVPTTFRSSPTMGELESLPAEEQQYLRELAMEVMGMDPVEAVAAITKETLDDTQKPALWSLLDSKTRAAIKKAQQLQKAAA